MHSRKTLPYTGGCETQHLRLSSHLTLVLWHMYLGAHTLAQKKKKKKIVRRLSVEVEFSW